VGPPCVARVAQPPPAVHSHGGAPPLAVQRTSRRQGDIPIRLPPHFGHVAIISSLLLPPRPNTYRHSVRLQSTAFGDRRAVPAISYDDVCLRAVARWGEAQPRGRNRCENPPPPQVCGEPPSGRTPVVRGAGAVGAAGPLIQPGVPSWQCDGRTWKLRRQAHLTRWRGRNTLTAASGRGHTLVDSAGERVASSPAKGVKSPPDTL